MTWLPLSATAAARDPFERVFALRPDLFEAFRDFSALFWTRRLVDPVVLELCRLRVAQLLGARYPQSVRTPEPLAAGLSEGRIAALDSWWTSDDFDPTERACLRFAEQFVLDAKGITDADAAAVVGALGDAGTVAFVEALAIFDGFSRFCCALEVEGSRAALLAGARLRSPAARCAPPSAACPARVKAPATRSADPIQASPLALQPELLQAFLRLYGTLWSHGELDQASKELARIRNARTIDCPICKAIRFQGAREEGLTEDVVELIRDGYEASDLSARQKAILRYVDAFLASPGEIGEDLRRELLAHFTPAQVVELTAAVALFMGFSKIAVALGGLPDAIPVHEQPTPAWPATA